MAEHDRVLMANEGFYLAFAEGDAPAMEALWAERAPVACIHPGWAPLWGREQVMRSWRDIFDAGPPPIRCHGARAHLYGEVAFVTCYEAIDGGLLAATNIFVREDEAWKMVHHHAGPAALPGPGEEGEAPGVLH